MARRTTSDVLTFIRRYVSEHGYAPSVRDIQHGLTISSTSTVAYHLQKLEAGGCIARDAGVFRSIRLTGEVKA